MRQGTSKHNSFWPFVILASLLASVFGAIAPIFARHYGLLLQPAISIYCCFLLLIILVIAPGVEGVRIWAGEQLSARRNFAVLPILWCLPYLAYSAGTFDFRWAALIRLLAVPLPLLSIYLLLPVRDVHRFTWQDLTVATWLIATLLSHQLNGIWSVPVNLDFMVRLFLIAVASSCWVFVRRVPELGYNFSFSTRIFRAAALNFGIFAAIAIPVSLMTQFTMWNPRWRRFPDFCLEYLEIFLFIALLEELFFRGFLQTLLSNTVRSAWKGQAITACLFGLFHVLHAPFPNWRYVALATVAGWFYGSAFRQGGSLMASALTHSLVDTVWRTFFSKS